MEELPKRLRSARKQSKLTQTALAKKANTTVANISGYEAGKQAPSCGMLYRLSAALNCSLDYLLGLTDNQTIKPTQKVIIYDELIKQYKITTNEGHVLERNEIEEMLDYILIRRLMKKS